MNAVIELEAAYEYYKNDRNLTRNSQNFSTNMQADLQTVLCREDDRKLLGEQNISETRGSQPYGRS